MSRTSRTTYHASLCSFPGDVRISRLTQGGGVAGQPRRGSPFELHHRAIPEGANATA